jgi:hypothetical protein
MGQHSAEEQPQRSDLLQPVALPRSQPGRAVLQPDQAMSSGGNTRYDKLAANYLACSARVHQAMAGSALMSPCPSN